MKIFDYSILQNKLWDNDILGYIADIRELKGKQELYTAQKPNELEKLIEIAKIQSTEASNEIEGIKTTSTRLKQLFRDKTTPKNRDEEEIAGYKDALNVIHDSFDYIPLTSNYILQLHKIMYSHQRSNIGGKFKNVQNHISSTGSDGESFVLFMPLSPYETPDAVEKLCNEFNKAIDDNIVDPLILIPYFIHDFLCIHPFRDGNGRMSRLLTTLLLYRCGYGIGRYISLESKIYKSKTLYYNALEQSQHGWHSNKSNNEPFIKYLLGTILSAYRDFKDRYDLIAIKSSSIDIIRKAIESLIGKFTKANLIEICPMINIKSIESSLKRLLDSNEITKHGSGRATYYTRNI